MVVKKKQPASQASPRRRSPRTPKGPPARRENYSSDVDGLVDDLSSDGAQSAWTRGRWSSSDVTAAVVLAGSENEVLERLRAMIPSKQVLRQTVQRLRESEAHAGTATLLEHYAASRGFTLSAVSAGKKCPTPGETRVYVVQTSPRGSKKYIALPVNCLGLNAGDRVIATFGPTITVQAE